MALQRLDKLLAQSGERSRSDAAKLIRAGLVSVGGGVVRDPARKVDAALSTVLLRGREITDEPYQYVMLHKPAGVLTAASDRHARTVMNLLPPAMQARGVMPVGRLDKDTTGLLLLTSDGTLAHRLLAPKTHVWKEYVAAVDGLLTGEHTAAFAAGVRLRDFQALPAELEIVSASERESRAVVRVREGKFHQVRRMFQALGLKVTSLHRRAFGPLQLDVAEGGYRALRPQEIGALYQAALLDREGQDG